MSTFERNSLMANLIVDLGLASEQDVAQSLGQFQAKLTNSDHDFLEELLCEKKIISLRQKDRLAEIAMALDRFDRMDDGQASISTDELTRTVASDHQERSKNSKRDPHLEFTIGSTSHVDPIEQRSSQPNNRTFPANRFRTLRPFAQGGLGSISVALDTEVHRIVALKEIQPQFVKSKESRNRFLFEGQVTGRLEHPGIVPVYSLGADQNGQPYYAMRLIQGDSMSKEIKDYYKFEYVDEKSSFLPWLRKMTGRLQDVCMAIEFAHSQGILHRDLKPANIMLGNYGETLVVDWGLAKSIKDERSGAEQESSKENANETLGHHTRTGAAIGTVGYMSPEQASGNHDDITQKSDVFCLGSTLYAILTGQSPYQDAKQLSDVKQGAFATPRSLNRRIPRGLEAICIKAMAIEPSERYDSARDLSEDLASWNADQPIQAWREPWLDHLGRLLRKYRTIAIASFIGLLALSGGLFAYNSAINDKNRIIEQSNNDLTQSLVVARESSMKLLEEVESNLNMNDAQRSAVLENIYRIYNKIHKSNQNDPKLTREFARVLRTSANALRFINDKKVPKARYNQAIGLIQPFVTGKPVTESRSDRLALVEIQTDFASLLNTEDRFLEAEKLLRNSLSLLQELKTNSSQDLGVIRAEALANYEFLEICNYRLDWEQALQFAERAEGTFQRLLDNSNRGDVDHILLIRSMASRANALAKLNRTTQATQQFNKTVLVGEKYLQSMPDRNVRFVMATLYSSYFGVLLNNDSQNHRELAKDLVVRWEKVAVENATDHPNVHLYEYAKADNLRAQARLLSLNGLDQKAAPKLWTAINLLKPYLKNSFYSAIPISAARCYRDLAQLAVISEEDRTIFLSKAVAILDSLIQVSSENVKAIELREEVHLLIRNSTGPNAKK